MTHALLKKIETPDPIGAYLGRLGIESVSYAHPPVFRVGEDAGFARGIPGGHTKNLFLKDKAGALWLVTALQDTAIDLRRLAARLGAGRFSFARPALLEEALGVIPGAVTPLALVNDAQRRVRPVIDAALMACGIVNVHPLRNDRTTGLSPADLLKFLESLGYRPVVVDFSHSASISGDGGET